MRNPSEAPFVTPCIGFALLAALVIWGIQRTAARQRSWPTVSARIEKSGVRELQELERRDNSPDRWRTSIAPRSSTATPSPACITPATLRLSNQVSSNPETIARKRAEKYPVGIAVHVHYNPDNPAKSVIKPRAPALLLLSLIPAAMLTLAYFVGR